MSRFASASLPSLDTPEFAALFPAVRAYLLYRERHESPNAEAVAAWEQFHGPVARWLRFLARKRRVSPANLDDCVQDVWGDVIVGLRTSAYDPQRGRFFCWLFILMRNAAVDRERAQTRHPTVALEAEQEAELLSHAGEPTVEVERRELWEKISSLLDRLEEQVSALNWQVFHLRWLERRSIAEIASALKLSPEQVRARCSRLKKRVVRLFRTQAEAFFP